MAKEFIKAKPTEYNGVLYRSKLEAQWAVFFQTLIDMGMVLGFDYEPQTFDTGGGNTYTPDFHIQERDRSYIVEIKPADLSQGYLHFWRAFSTAYANTYPGKQAVIFKGSFFALGVKGEPIEVITEVRHSAIVNMPRPRSGRRVTSSNDYEVHPIELCDFYGQFSLSLVNQALEQASQHRFDLE